MGVDIVDVGRFTTSLERTPSLAERLFTPRELAVDRPERLAARFAAKEATAKALGAPSGLRWHDAVIHSSDDGSPQLQFTDTVAKAVAERGATSWHVSLSHDGGMAIAVVILES
jgi:holo-[acyl-carrier protein] synthase